MINEMSPNPEQSEFHREEQKNKGPSLSWKCHPATRKPLVTIAVTLFVLLVTAAVFYSTDSRTFAVLTLLIMFGSLAKFYFPTSYTLTDEGIIIKTTTQTLRKEWSLYRSYYPDKNGILLSPFVRPTRLENFRGLYVMFNNNKDEVIAFVKAHISSETKESIQEKENK